MRFTCWSSVLLVLFFLSASGMAQIEEVKGYENYQWGTHLDQVLKENPQFKSKYSLSALRQALKKSDYVWIIGPIKYLDYDGEIRYFFDNKERLFKVTLVVDSIEEKDFDGAAQILNDLKKKYGEPQKTIAKLYVWFGKYSLIEAEDQAAPCGFKVEINFAYLKMIKKIDPDKLKRYEIDVEGE